MCCSATGDIIVLFIQLAIKAKHSKPICVPAIAFTRWMWFWRNSCRCFSTICKTHSHTSHGKRWIVSKPQKAMSGKRLLDRKLINVTHIFRVSNVSHASRYAWPCKMSVFITYGARFREFQSVLHLCFVYVGLSSRTTRRIPEMFYYRIVSIPLSYYSPLQEIATITIPWAGP